MSATAKLLLILLAQNLDAKTVYKVNKLLIDLLADLAEKTSTDLDDKVVAMVGKFLRMDEPQN